MLGRLRPIRLVNDGIAHTTDRSFTLGTEGDSEVLVLSAGSDLIETLGRFDCSTTPPPNALLNSATEYNITMLWEPGRLSVIFEDQL